MHGSPNTRLVANSPGMEGVVAVVDSLRWRWAVEGNGRYTSKVGVTEYKTLR